jgi:hypothetical protein
MIVVDTHLHLYPCYDLGRAFAELSANLARGGGENARRVGCLAERRDCRAFSDLRAGRRVPPPPWRAVPAAEPCAVRLEDGAERSVLLVAGRQIATAERIEVLGLGLVEPVPDGLPAAESVARVRAAAGVPVLAWAPGKWFFGRGRIVRSLIDDLGPGVALVGDSSLRPTVWPEPRLMKRARRRGLAVAAGSDPLPFAGEESVMGRYATVIDAGLDDTRPAGTLLAMLAAGRGRTVGRRQGPLAVLRRLARNARAVSAAGAAPAAPAPTTSRT